MISILGTYENGQIKFAKDFSLNHPTKVIVTFIEDIQIETKEGFSIADFSFKKSKVNLNSFQGSLSNVVLEERRNEL
ncbi:MAG: hypothetical protein IE931_13255 [Sphingobacteriales bacterium]|nr:hypothetical protein [Sphingobacteriales bacterium]